MPNTNEIEAVVSSFAARLAEVLSGQIGRAIDAMRDDIAGVVEKTPVFPKSTGHRTQRAVAVTKGAPKKTPARGPGRPRKDASAAGGPRPRKRAKGAPAEGRSTPAEVTALGEKIVALLAGSEKHLSGKEIQAGLKLSDAEGGRFQYALGRVKKSGAVKQYGVKGNARYGAGRG